MQEAPDFADPSLWRRPWFVMAAVFLTLVVVLGIAVAVWPRDQDTSSPAQAPAGAPSNDTSQPTASPLPTALPTTAPGDITWQLVGQVAVPVSRFAGPRTVTGGVAAGFAHTPEGALVAAAQLAIRAAFSTGKSSWEPTLQHSFVPGTDRDRLLANLRAAPQQQAEPGELSPLAGYIYQAYTPDTAVIGLVFRSPGASTNAQYHAVTNTMQWHGEDWQMVAPPDGSWLSVNRTAADLTGVVQWGAR